MTKLELYDTNVTYERLQRSTFYPGRLHVP